MLIDSLEDGRAFRNYLERNFEVIKGDIERVAKEIGVKYLIYNVPVGNETHRKFIEKLEENTDKYKINIIGNEEIPYDYAKDGKHHLEAFVDSI